MRTLRVLRSMVGIAVSLVVIMPITLAVYFTFFEFYRPEERKVSLVEIVAFVIVASGFYLVNAYLCFWLLRAFAAGSLSAVRFVLVVLFSLAAFNVISLIWDIFDFVTADTQFSGSGDWSTRPLLAVLIAILIIYLFVVCLLLTGPLRIRRCRGSPVFPLFLNHNYQRGFWPGRAVLLRNLWALLGIPILPNQKKVSKRVIIAALAALTLDSSVLLWLASFPDKIESSLYKVEISHQEIFLTTAVPVFLSPFIFWLIFILSRRLRRYARRRALLSMDKARLIDPRRPVLFLRSFGDDQISLAQAKVPWLMRFFDPLAIAGTLEELLVQEFGYLGPFPTVVSPAAI